MIEIQLCRLYEIRFHKGGDRASNIVEQRVHYGLTVF